MLKIAIDTLVSQGLSCVIARDGKIINSAIGGGLAPLLGILQASPLDFNGSCVADKVIGRAAASLLICAGVKEAHGQIMSRGAYDFLSANGVSASYGKLVDIIENRTKTGMCPMEQSSFKSDEPTLAFQAVLDFIAEMKLKNG